MKTQLPYLFLALGTAGAILLALPSHSPAQAGGDDPAVVSMIAEVLAQQVTLQENQTKIDEKIAAIAEAVRQARLFTARGGNKQ